MFTWTDGKVYKGGFEKGEMQGEGVLTFRNGNRVVGEWY